MNRKTTTPKKKTQKKKTKEKMKEMKTCGRERGRTQDVIHGHDKPFNGSYFLVADIQFLVQRLSLKVGYK